MNIPSEHPDPDDGAAGTDTRPDAPPREERAAPRPATADDPSRPPEIGGQAGPEPTRYGDWEKRGRCTDF